MKGVFFVFLGMYAFVGISQSYEVVPFEKGGKWGLLNSKKQIVQFPAYDSVGFNDSGFGFIIKNKGKYGLLNPEGESLLPIKYKGIRDTLGYFILNTNKKRYYFEAGAKKIIQWSDDFLDDKVPIQEASVTSLVGNLQIRKPYDSQKNYFMITPTKDTSKVKKTYFQNLYEEGIYPSIFSNNNKKGVIWGKLNIVSYNENAVWATIKYDTLFADFDSITINLLDCQQQSKITKACLDKVSCFVCQKSQKWGIVSYSKQVMLPFEWDFIERRSISSDYAFVSKDGLWGWINTQTLRFVAKPRFKVIRRIPTKVADVFFYVETTEGKKGYVSASTGRAWF